MTDMIKRPLSRLWTIENRAGPANIPNYQGLAKAGAASWAFGDRTPIRNPSNSRYGGFNIADAIKGERGLPSLPITARYLFTVSEFLRLGRIGCPFDIQVHFGKCQNPMDFNRGWDKILVLEGADISNWSPDELGALEQSEDAVVNETVDTNGLDMYEVKRLTMQEIAASQIVQEVISVVLCDSVACGACGIPSDGVSTFFAVTVSAGGSPGLPAEVIYSRDKGITLGQTNISTLGVNEDPTGAACVATFLVVISNESCSIHYAPLADILDGTETWTEVATGLVCAAGAPNGIFALDAAHIWIVGDAGYLYFSDDIESGVSVQDAGVVTANDLNAVHAYDDQNVVAVGAANTVLFSENGGTSWSSITGPAGGIVLNTVFMHGKDEWFIGTANGRLYYTRDQGTTWTEKTFNGSGAGVVRHITFPTPTVGYMARINWIAATQDEVNIFFAGGLADDAADGILVKGA